MNTKIIVGKVKDSKLAWFIGIYAVSILAYGSVTIVIHYLIKWIK